MSYQDVLPRQVMEGDSPDFSTLDLVDDLIKKDYTLDTTGVLIDSSNAIIDHSDAMLHPTGTVYYDEETMPMGSISSYIAPQEHAFPYLHQTGPPDQTVYPGPFNFEVKISSKSNKNSKFLYSEGLNKLYADINCDFPVQFSWSPSSERMFVRATVVFAASEHSGKRVECCMQHRHAPDVAEHIRLNVLRSSRELGTLGVYYGGSASDPDSWYWVAVEFSAGQPQTHAYKFVCKNSCSSGINRRATAVLYELLGLDGKVYGRRKMDARICSCPPRDCRKDEETAGIIRTKKRIAKPEGSKCKKVKIETNPGDVDVITLPPVQVVGLNVLTAGLDMMVKMTEHGRNLRKDDPQYVQACDSSIESLKATIEQYRRDDHT